jgi:peptidoglycan/xylan/chitin deacetylase (PgdA/CDA1 family)
MNGRPIKWPRVVAPSFRDGGPAQSGKHMQNCTLRLFGALHLAHHKNATKFAASMSTLQYGPRVVMPRILAFYREMGIKQTFFIPSWCIERYPDAVEAALADGHEVAHHGYLHEHPNELSREREEYWFRRALDVLARFTGARPVGYRAPAYRFSSATMHR